MKINGKQVSYLTEDPAKEYSKAISATKTVEQLVNAIIPFIEIADDALEIAKSLSKADYIEFMKGLKKERRGEFAGEKFADKYASLIMPEKMFIASIVSDQYKIPWGLAAIRCEQNKWVMQS